MKIVPFNIYGGQFLVGDCPSRGVWILVQFAMDGQSRSGRGRGDQVDDHLVTDQRLAAPVHADVGEQAVLDFVPLARAGRKMMHGDGHAQFVGEGLQRDLPQPHAAAVAAAPVGRDQQSPGVGIDRPSPAGPPAPDGFDGEQGRVVIGSHADPASVARQIVDAERADPIVPEIVNKDTTQYIVATLALLTLPCLSTRITRPWLVSLAAK